MYSEYGTSIYFAQKIIKTVFTIFWAWRFRMYNLAVAPSIKVINAVYPMLLGTLKKLFAETHMKTK